MIWVRPISHAMGKVEVTLTIEQELMDWVKSQVDTHQFDSVSQGFEYAMAHLRDESRQGKKGSKSCLMSQP